MKSNYIIRMRLNELMNEYGVSFSSIARYTGISRQTITSYFDGKSNNIPLNFIQKYYLYLKSLKPDKNLNFLYLIDPDYPTKNTTTEKDLKIIGLEQKAIDNLYNIVEYKGNNAFDKFFESEKYYKKPELNAESLYTLNLILSSPALQNIVDEMNSLRARVYSGTPKHLDCMYEEIKNIENLVQNKKLNNSKNKEEVDFYNELLRDIQNLSLNAIQLENEQKYNLQYEENPDYFNYLKWKLENAIKSLVDDVSKKIIDAN